MQLISSLPDKAYKTCDNEIYELVRNYIFIFGYDCDLSWIDTSDVTDMSQLF
jgi:hypothetical protein